MLPSPAVTYLTVFHIIFVFFVWTYWKAIFTPPQQPDKKVKSLGVLEWQTGLLTEPLPEVGVSNQIQAAQHRALVAGDQR